MTRKIIDLDSVQPNGMRGETQRPAFTKINDNFAEVYGALDGVTAIGKRVDSLESALQSVVPGRNRLINGNFDFWQLGCTHTVNRGGNLPAGGAAPESRRFLNSVVSKTSAGSSAYVAQKVESAATLSDGDVTVSGFAYGPPGKRIGVRLIQHFGTGGSPSAAVSVELGTVAVTATSWTYFQLSARLPSVKGKTLGSNADSDFLWLVVDLCADAYGGVISGQNGEFGIAMMQLERGNRATAFDLRPLAHELQLCQRYYEKSYDNDVVPGTPTNSGRYSWGNSAASGATSYLSVPFKTCKRVTPVIVVRPNNNVVEPGYVNQDDSSRTPASVPTIATNVFEVAWGNSPGRWGGWFHWTADAEIY